MARKFLLYAGRWQLSTPVLAVVTIWMGASFMSAMVANLIGAGIFFWVDRAIFGGRT